MRHDLELARLAAPVADRRPRRPFLTVLCWPRSAEGWIGLLGIVACLVALVLVPGRYLLALVMSA